jgi:hypothetical protein
MRCLRAYPIVLRVRPPERQRLTWKPRLLQTELVFYRKFVSCKRQRVEGHDKRRPSRPFRMHMSVRADSTIYDAMADWLAIPLVVVLARGLVIVFHSR